MPEGVVGLSRRELDRVSVRSETLFALCTQLLTHYTNSVFQ